MVVSTAPHTRLFLFTLNCTVLPLYCVYILCFSFFFHISTTHLLTLVVCVTPGSLRLSQEFYATPVLCGTMQGSLWGLLCLPGACDTGLEVDYDGVIYGM